MNQPGRGLKDEGMFSPHGVQDNEDMMQFLRNIGFEIEAVKYPWGETDPKTDFIMLMARKV
jgi:hypothetical protein